MKRMLLIMLALMTTACAPAGPRSTDPAPSQAETQPSGLSDRDERRPEPAVDPDPASQPDAETTEQTEPGIPTEFADAETSPNQPVDDGADPISDQDAEDQAQELVPPPAWWFPEVRQSADDTVLAPGTADAPTLVEARAAALRVARTRIDAIAADWDARADESVRNVASARLPDGTYRFWVIIHAQPRR